MRAEDAQDWIITLLHEQKGSQLSSAKMASIMRLKGNDNKKLQRWLNRLVRDERIIRNAGGLYSLSPSEDLLTGRLSMLRSGSAFLSIAGGDSDVFVARRDLGMALPGDTVSVRLLPQVAKENNLGAAGKVVSVLERARHDLVGTLRSTGRFLYVVPIDPVYRRDFYVPKSNGAKTGDRVVARFTGWQNKHVNPEAEIIEVIGPSDSPSVDTLSVIKHFGFKIEFSSEAMQEAATASLLMEKPGKRVDLRNDLIITIDPDRARDFDDALSLKKDENGNLVLGVHIADVSHFVKPGGALDEEAKSRGNSVYFADRVIPMLPEQLSNGVCSLRPDEDRLAISVFLTINRSGVVVDRKVVKSIIKSKRRLTYVEAMALIKSKLSSVPKNGLKRDVKQLLDGLNAVAQQLRTKRFARYALNLDVPECEVEIDKNGRMTGLKVVVNDHSHQLVEECMIAANEAVAIELSDKGVPGIARFHDKPSEEKIEQLSILLTDMGYNPGDLSKPKNMSSFLSSVAEDPLAHQVRIAVLKSMNRAIYSATETGHFGLAKKFYSHFTSPIRRYPDLVIHRQLGSFISGPKKKPLYDKSTLSQLATNCSWTESTADEAERALLEIKKYRYLEQELADKKPRVYDAIVIKATTFGVFVEVLDLQLVGLVHDKAMDSDRSKKHRRGRPVRRAGKKKLKEGSKVKVHVVRVDFDKRRLDFELS